jgi:hypothetical protein
VFDPVFIGFDGMKFDHLNLIVFEFHNNRVR